MYNVRRKEYRGYRIETHLRDAVGWRVYLYRLSMKLPPMVRQRHLRYVSWAQAIAAGERKIDMELDAGALYRAPGQSGLFRTYK